MYNLSYLLSLHARRLPGSLPDLIGSDPMRSGNEAALRRSLRFFLGRDDSASRQKTSRILSFFVCLQVQKASTTKKKLTTTTTQQPRRHKQRSGLPGIDHAKIVMLANVQGVGTTTIWSVLKRLFEFATSSWIPDRFSHVSGPLLLCLCCFVL